MRMYDEGLKSIDKSIALEPKTGLWLLRKALIFRSLRRFDEALHLNGEAHALDPKLVDALNNRGTIYIERREWEKALAELERASAFNPQYALAFANRGTVFRRTNKPEQALAELDKAIRLDPNLAHAHTERAWVYWSLGNRDAAFAGLASASAADQNLPWPYALKGHWLYEVGDFEAAASALNKAVELDVYGSNSHTLLKAHLASLRVSLSNAEIQFRERAPRFQKTSWPQPIVDFYLGTASAEAVMAEAGNDDETCEARYFIGAMSVRRGAVDAGRHLLTEAVENCLSDNIEFHAAKTELQNMHVRR